MDFDVIWGGFGMDFAWIFINCNWSLTAACWILVGFLLWILFGLLIDFFGFFNDCEWISKRRFAGFAMIQLMFV